MLHIMKLQSHCFEVRAKSRNTKYYTGFATFKGLQTKGERNSMKVLSSGLTELEIWSFTS